MGPVFVWDKMKATDGVSDGGRAFERAFVIGLIVVKATFGTMTAFGEGWSVDWQISGDKPDSVTLTSSNFSTLRQDVLQYKKNSKVPRPQASRGGRSDQASLQDWLTYLLRTKSITENASMDGVRFTLSPGTTGVQGLTSSSSQLILPRSVLLKYLDMSLEPQSKGLYLKIPSGVRESLAHQDRIFVPAYSDKIPIQSIQLGHWKQWNLQNLGTVKTEPTLARGEKIFKNACISCHFSSDPSASQKFLKSSDRWLSSKTQGHAEIFMQMRFDSKENRALEAYLQSLRGSEK